MKLFLDTSIFGTLGMLVVFIVIGFLTFVIWASGFLLGLSGKVARRTRKGPAHGVAPADGGVPSEHIAMIAAALAAGRTGPDPDVSMLAGSDAGRWRTGSSTGRPPGWVPGLRRSR